MPSETRRALIVVRTYPTPPPAAGDQRCPATAAITPAGDWMRLFPCALSVSGSGQAIQKVSMGQGEGFQSFRPPAAKIRPCLISTPAQLSGAIFAKSGVLAVPGPLGRRAMSPRGTFQAPLRTSSRTIVFSGRCWNRHTTIQPDPSTAAANSFMLLSQRTLMKLLRLVLAATFALALAAPAAAQRYTAKQDGDVIELADTTAQMNVSVVWSMSNAWRIQVKGKDLVRTSATLADFQARPGFNGMPLLAPFANRLDETAFYANGKKYNFDLELGNVRGPIPSTGFVNGSKAWQLVEFKADGKGAWVTCKLDFYKNPQFMKQFPFAHTITMTYRVADGALEVRTRLDNLSTEPMPVVIGYHPIYELPDGNRNDWTVSVDAKTHWIEIPQRLPTGETQPIENFFGSDRTAIQLRKYALIDDVFTDLVRDANGRATMKLMYNGKELHVILGPKYKTVLMWSTPLGGGGGGGRGGGAGRGGGQGQGAPAAGGGRAAAAAPAPSGPFPVDPAQGVKVAPPAVPPAEGAPAPATKGFIAFEPMVAITNALNLAHKGVYKDLQSIPPGGSWEESFWITTKGY